MAIGEALKSLKTRLGTKLFHLSCVYKCVFLNGVRASIMKEAAGYKMGDDGENIYCPRCESSMVHTKKLSTLTLFQWFQPQLPLIISDGKKERSSISHYI